MSILVRVEGIRSHEHLRLRVALERASRALDALKEAHLEALQGPRDVDMFGDPVGGADEQRSPLARLNLAPMLVAWGPFEDLLLERVDTWEMDLWPLVRRWTQGERVTPAVQTVASGMLARRTRLQPLLRDVRMQVSFVGELRAPVMAVFAAVEQCDDAEASVVPALISGRLDEVEESLDTVPPRQLSSEHISRNLRNSSRPSVPRKSAPESSGLFGSIGRIVGWGPKR